MACDAYLVVEGLSAEQLVLGCCVLHCLCLVSIGSKGLLTEHVLACLESCCCPVTMQAVGCGHIDGCEAGVIYEILVGAIGLGDPARGSMCNTITLEDN